MGVLRSVLLVEDNADHRQILIEYLELKKVKVFCALNAEEAPAIAADVQPDLILMDINLPNQNGFWATRRILQNEKTSHIPIIAVTANVLVVNEQRARESGCAGLLLKPLELTHLVERLEAFLPK